jgi:hypothetical protein
MRLPYIHDSIFGWFDFADIYAQVVESAPKEGAHFVEVGSFLGKSTSFMAVEIANSEKRIVFDAVDTWLGNPSQPETFAMIKDHAAGDAFAAFIANMKRGGLMLYVNAVRLPSTRAAALYQDSSLDFVFIDAEHAYESCRDDIRAWWRKVKPGGTIAGHDVFYPSVNQAVTEFFGNAYVIRGNSWVVQCVRRCEVCAGPALVSVCDRKKIGYTEDQDGAKWDTLEPVGVHHFCGVHQREAIEIKEPPK